MIKFIVNTIFLSFLLIISAEGGKAQDSISLEQCFIWLRDAHPLSRSADIIVKQKELEINKLRANFYPDLSVNGQLTYQSDVTTIDIPFPGIDIPVPQKDNYKL